MSLDRAERKDADRVVEQHVIFVLAHQLGGLPCDLAVGNLHAGNCDGHFKLLPCIAEISGHAFAVEDMYLPSAVWHRGQAAISFAACGVFRKLIAMRLYAFIRPIAMVRSTSSRSSNTARAAS